MSLTPLAFTGVSSFSDDFQTILKRTVAIASVPLQGLQNERKDLLGREQLLSNLQAVVAELGSNLSALGDLGQNKGITANSSNTSKVTVASTGATQTGSYVISEITS